MSYKAWLSYLVSIIGLVVAAVSCVKGMSAGVPSDLPGVSSVSSASYYYIAASAFVFSFFAFVGARVVHYCDDSLALKEQANDILRQKIKADTSAKKKCTKCGEMIFADAITCPRCGQ